MEDYKRDKRGRFLKGHSHISGMLGKKATLKTRELMSFAHKGKSLKPKTVKNCIVCGNIFTVSPSRINRNHCSKKCTFVSKIGKIPWNKGKTGIGITGKNHPWFGRNMTGKNNPHWIENRNLLQRNSIDDKARSSSAYNYWRNEVKKRDNYKCKINNNDCKGKLVAHHILGWKDPPELRYEINNGITLCLAHHPRKRAEEKRLIPTFTELMSVSKVQF